MTLRQGIAVAALQLAATVGAQRAGGPTILPSPPDPAPIVAAAPPPAVFRDVTKNIPAPAPAPPVVAPSVAWYTAAARREYDRLHPR